MDKLELVHKITIDVEKGVSLSELIGRLIEIDEEESDLMISESFNFEISNTITEEIN